MTLKLPRDGTISKKVLSFIGNHQNGVPFGEIQRFICTLSGLSYDDMETVSVYDYKTRTSKKKTVRVHRGRWSTNLCHGKNALLHKFCKRTTDRKWVLSDETRKLIAYDGALPKTAVKSSLETSTFRSDEIQGNSKVVDRKLITLPVSAPTTPPNPDKIRNVNDIDNFEWVESTDGEGRITRQFVRKQPKATPEQMLINLQVARAKLELAQAELNKARKAFEIAGDYEMQCADQLRTALKL